MYGYMTESISAVDAVYSMDFSATGSDYNSMIFNLLDECLYNFTTEPFFIGRVVRVVELDRENFVVKIRAWGDSFDKERHPPGTEVKAITYSNMQVNITDSDTHIYVIVDI